MRKFYNDRPNFTIIMPVGCQAKCGFCFWNQKQLADQEAWLNKLKRKLSNPTLRNLITTISISGGEPTLNPELLIKVLEVIESTVGRVKVVLNTNGYQLKQVASHDKFLQMVCHINLSRHTYNHHANTRIFGTDEIITDDGIREVVHILEDSNSLIDITLNVVYGNDIIYLEEFSHVEQIDIMIEYTRSLYINKIAFRKDVEFGLEHSLLEKSVTFDVGVTPYVTTCPVCKQSSMRRKGIELSFKYGVADTYDHLPMLANKVYELIFHENGKLCYDWKGQKGVALPTEAPPERATATATVTPSRYTSSGCGYRTRGC